MSRTSAQFAFRKRVSLRPRGRNEPGAGAIIPVPSRGRMWLTNGPPHGNWAEERRSQPRQFAVSIAVRSWWISGLCKGRTR